MRFGSVLFGIAIGTTLPFFAQGDSIPLCNGEDVVVPADTLGSFPDSVLLGSYQVQANSVTMLEVNVNGAVLPSFRGLRVDLTARGLCRLISNDDSYEWFLAVADSTNPQYFPNGPRGSCRLTRTPKKGGDKRDWTEWVNPKFDTQQDAIVEQDDGQLLLKFSHCPLIVDETKAVKAKAYAIQEPVKCLLTSPNLRR